MQLEVIQSRLLDVGSAVATPIDSSPEAKLKRVQFDAQSTSQLEVGWQVLMAEHGVANGQIAKQRIRFQDTRRNAYSATSLGV